MAVRLHLQRIDKPLARWLLAKNYVGLSREPIEEPKSWTVSYACECGFTFTQMVTRDRSPSTKPAPEPAALSLTMRGRAGGYDKEGGPCMSKIF
jgi:hypothetical protein